MNTRRPSLHSSAVLALLLVFALPGCGSSPPSRFYLLTPVDLQSSAVQGKGSLALGRVILPEYLDRPQMTSFISSSELSYAEFDRWAEPLGENIRRVMLLNLGQLLGGASVEEAPSPVPLNASGTLVVRIQSFEMDQGGQLRLRATWSIHDPVSGEIQTQGGFSQVRTPADRGYATRAGEMSALLGALCVDIVKNMP